MAVWVVLRNFLRYGSEQPTGDGQVRIRPDASPQRIRLDLSGEWGTQHWVTLPGLYY